jgi:hypothetical protein
MTRTHARDDRLDALQKLFGRQPVLRLDQLERALGTSGRTVFRALAALGYHSSYSHAGRYYTLRRIPRFDAHGLWSRGEVRFSTHGTLRATVVVLVTRSPAGHTHDELQAILGLRVHDTLRALVESKELSRARFELRYVYLHPDPKLAAAQLARRQAQTRAAAPAAPTRGPLDLARVVDVLVAVIQEPGAAPAALAARLRTRGREVSEEPVEGVFGRYGLKKPARSRSRRWRR